jgi:hypothetical protein
MKRTTIIVIDGMGGGIGCQLIGKLKDSIGGNVGMEIIALGSNAVAAERMIKAGANRGAAGENAIRLTAPLGDFILGPIGIVITDSMMGEITATMTGAILAAPGERILLPLQEHFFIAGLEQQPMARLIDKAIDIFKERLIARLKNNDEK